jgi:hypothetical protein
MLVVVVSCTNGTQPRQKEELYVSTLVGVEQQLVLEPDGTYVLRNPTSESRGKYTREGQTLTLLSAWGTSDVLTLDGEAFVDASGFKWTKR